jgi:hypothetical protein
MQKAKPKLKWFWNLRLKSEYTFSAIGCIVKTSCFRVMNFYDGPFSESYFLHLVSETKSIAENVQTSGFLFSISSTQSEPNGKQ